MCCNKLCLLKIYAHLRMFVHICTCMYVCKSFCARVCVLRSNINTFIINERPLRPRAQNAYAKAAAQKPHPSAPPAAPRAYIRICLCILWLTASVICHLPLGATCSGLVMSSDHRPGGLSQYQSPPVAYQRLTPSIHSWSRSVCE